MRYERIDDGGVAVLRPTGADALDTSCAAALKDLAAAAFREGRDVVVDLAEVRFVDSAGVGALVSVFKGARSHGRRAAFCGLHAGVRSVLTVIRLDQILEIRPDTESAVRAFTLGVGAGLDA